RGAATGRGCGTAYRGSSRSRAWWPSRAGKKVSGRPRDCDQSHYRTRRAGALRTALGSRLSSFGRVRGRASRAESPKSRSQSQAARAERLRGFLSPEVISLVLLDPLIPAERV